MGVREMRTRRRLILLFLVFFFFVAGRGALFQIEAHSLLDDDDDGAARTADLPTGMRITPTAASGSRFSVLNPNLPGSPEFTAGQAVSTAVSPDGNTLLILTSGYNIRYDASGNLTPQESNEYVFVYDITTQPPRKMQVLQVATAFNGLAWNPSGNEFYISGGEQDVVHVFARQGAVWAEAGAPVRLGHAAGLGLGVPPEVAGIGVNAAGTQLIATNYENDSISVVDIASRAKIAELDLRPGKSDPSKKGAAGGDIIFRVVQNGVICESILLESKNTSRPFGAELEVRIHLAPPMSPMRNYFLESGRSWFGQMRRHKRCRLILGWFSCRQVILQPGTSDASRRRRSQACRNRVTPS